MIHSLMHAQGNTDEAKPLVTAGVGGVWKHREIIAQAGAGELIPVILGKAATLLESWGDQAAAARWRRELAGIQGGQSEK